MTDLKYVLNVAILSACVCSCAITAEAQSACGLDDRNRRDVAMPVTQNVMGPDLVSAVARAYDLFAVQSRPEEGLVALRRVRQAVAGHNRCAEALAEFGMGEIETGIKLPYALPHLLRAAELLTAVGTPLAQAIAHQRVVVAQHLTGDNASFFAAAPQIQQQLRDAGDPASAIKLASLALQYAQDGQKPDAQAALAHELESVHTENAVAVRGFLQWEWGSALRRSGRYAEISAHFEASLADLAACDCEPQTHAAVLLNLAAGADSSGDAETVLRYATQADAVYRTARLDSLRSQSMRLMAAGYAHQRDWPRAIAEYNAGLQLARQQHAVSGITNLGLELAAVYEDSGQPLRGLETLAQTMPETLTPNERCEFVTQRSVLEQQAAQLPQALIDGEKALKECRELLQPVAYAALTMSQAQAQLQSGMIEEGLRSARAAVVMRDSQRTRVRRSDATMIEFNEHETALYTVLIEALLLNGKPEEALVASEENRARAFVDLATTARAGAGSRAEQVSVPGRPPSAASAPGDLRSEVHPFNLTIDSMRALVDRQHSTLVSYWVGEDRLFIWVMAPGKAVIEKDQPLSRVQLASLVQATLPGAATKASRGAPQARTRGGESQGVVHGSRKPWSDLYNLLIAPIATELPAEDGSLLTIVPQGPLFQLSFAALLNANNQYLIEHYAINVAPSVGTLEVTAKNEAAAAGLPARYVVLANPERLPAVDGITLPPLPGTQAEARGIQHQLEGGQVTLLEGSHAAIDTLNEALPGTTVLHFATHAVVDDRAPSASFLALDTRQEGGKLTTSSVYAMHLRMNLVVLSACRTGRGRVSGDGVVGLSRAFFYAGAASLVTTLWDVLDAPTAQLMPNFYGALARGESRSAALRESQLTLIHDLRLHRVRVPTLAGGTVTLPDNPAYWAAFSLSGQP